MPATAAATTESVPSGVARSPIVAKARASGGGDLGDRRLGALDVAAAAGDVRALAREAERDLAPDAARGARDERPLAGKSAHVRESPQRLDGRIGEGARRGPAVDDHLGAGDVRRALGEQERDQLGDLARLTDAQHRREQALAAQALLAVETSGGSVVYVIGVSMQPGSTAFARMPAGA